MISPITVKTALSKHDEAFPTLWDLNPYRGCSIGCKYCFAQYSHHYLGLDDFFKDIVVKTNIGEQLYAELKRKSWKREQIKLGGISDIYQPAEKKYELLPKVYDILKRTRNPVFIQTKSTLIYRDFEIIKELSKVTTVDISASICTFDEHIRKVLEPGAAPAIDRMKMLFDFKGICRQTVVAFMPVIPLISDTDENLETAFSLTKEYGLGAIITYPLHLRKESRIEFLQFFKDNFPEDYPLFSRLYRGLDLNENYKKRLYTKINRLLKKYSLSNSYSIVTPVVQKNQLDLF
jgi:DNA repair photolyase